MISRAFVLTAILAMGCDSAQTTPDATAPHAAAPEAAAAPAADAAAPAADATADPHTGAVLETMDAGGYTYMLLKLPAGDTWVAVGQTVVKVGDTVAITNPMVMKDFTSPTLGRTFPEILFATLSTGEAQPHAAMGGMGGMGAAPATNPEVQVATEVAKAEGPNARTVAEVQAQRAELAGKTVVVKGQVSKFLAGIMGRNWVHLQDGSGGDLTFTTQDTVAEGDVVTMTGTVASDKDFGAGYKYAVIVEEAKVVR